MKDYKNDESEYILRPDDPMICDNNLDGFNLGVIILFLIICFIFYYFG